MRTNPIPRRLACSLLVVAAALLAGASCSRKAERQAGPASLPLEAVKLRGEVVTRGSAGTVSIIVENTASQPVRLKRVLGVQTKDGEQWRSVETQGLYLRGECVADSKGVMNPSELDKGCVEVAPGSLFKAAPWLGTSGDAQCMCEHCARVRAGSYRFVATPCDGEGTVNGAPFEML